jgi:hypothetical protein
MLTAVSSTTAATAAAVTTSSTAAVVIAAAAANARMLLRLLLRLIAIATATCCCCCSCAYSQINEAEPIAQINPMKLLTCLASLSSAAAVMLSSARALQSTLLSAQPHAEQRVGYTPPVALSDDGHRVDLHGVDDLIQSGNLRIIHRKPDYTERRT